jgi:SAM-dependent methyltransferase
MDIETVDYLLSPEGATLLAAASSLSGSLLQRLTTLRKHYPAHLANAAVETLELRKRAEKKFSRAHQMFFTREALEQSSGEVISGYRAERYAEGSCVLDIACGIGGDTISLAQRCRVIAVDSDPVRIKMAEHNASVYGVSDNVRFICANAEDIDISADAAFIDPSRRVGGRRTINLSEISPSAEFIHRLHDAIPNTGVKLSPMMNDDDLRSLGGGMEFISQSGECKEAVVWYGSLCHASLSATVLPIRATICHADDVEAPIREPGRFIYEPEPCIIRAHLVDELAVNLGAWKLDASIAYLSSDERVDSPFWRGYKVEDFLPFNVKHLSRRLRELGIGRVIVKKRGVPFEPAEMEKRFKGPGEREAVLILTRIGDRHWAFICAPIQSQGTDR